MTYSLDKNMCTMIPISLYVIAPDFSHKCRFLCSGINTCCGLAVVMVVIEADRSGFRCFRVFP